MNKFPKVKSTFEWESFFEEAYFEMKDRLIFLIDKVAEYRKNNYKYRFLDDVEANYFSNDLPTEYDLLHATLDDCFLYKDSIYEKRIFNDAYNESKLLSILDYELFDCIHPKCNNKFFSYKARASQLMLCSDLCSWSWEKAKLYHGNFISRKNNNGIREKVFPLFLLKKQNFMCNMCEKKLDIYETERKEMITIDHIIPVTKGGSHTYENTQLLCWKCNFIKGNKILKTG